MGHFLSNERDRQLALRRGGRTPAVSLDAGSAERLYERSARDNRTPEKLFDARWAGVLLERALVRVEREYAAGNRVALFQHLKGQLTGDDGASHATAARTLEMTEGAVRVAAHRLRRRFREALLAEIAETVTDPADVDREVRHLLRAVSV